jgi:hypothetical protein
MREQPIIPPIATYALCAYCESPLYRKDWANDSEYRAGTDVGRARIHASILNGLLKLAAPMNRVNLRARFCKAISRLADKFGGGSAVTFFRRVGLPALIGKRWLAHQEKPSLPQIVRVCEALGAEPEEMLCGNQKALVTRLESRLTSGVPVMPTSPVVVRKASKRLIEEDRRKVAAQLKAELAKPTASEVIEIAREFRMTKFALRYWFPKEYAAISKAAAKRRAKAIVAKEQALKKDIKATCRRLNAHGVYPSKHRVKNALKRAGRISRWNPRLEAFLKEAQASPMTSRLSGIQAHKKNVLPKRVVARHPRSDRQ